MIVDEYTKESVEAYKEKEREEIAAAFNSHAQDFLVFLNTDLTLQEKVEAV